MSDGSSLPVYEQEVVQMHLKVAAPEIVHWIDELALVPMYAKLRDMIGVKDVFYLEFLMK